MKNKFLIIIFFFFIITSLSFSQEFDYEKEYTILSADYDSLLNDYQQLIEDNKKLNNIYEKEIDKHQLSKEQIIMDQTEIKMLRDNITDLLKLVDPKYFTLFIVGGYQGMNPLGELSISASVPKIPFAVLAGVEYIYFTGVNMKLGIGVKF